jgi:hypothetical protein
MGLINGRRVSLFVAVAAMETCWVVAWAHALLSRQAVPLPGAFAWRVFSLYIAALVLGGALSRYTSRFKPWLLGMVALLTLWLFLGVTPGGLLRATNGSSVPASSTSVIMLLLGFLVWYRALRIPGQIGDVRAIARQFQVGLLLLVVALLITSQTSISLSGLVVVFFGSGLLAVALTRIEEVAITEPGGAAPLSSEWVATLAGTLAVTGVVAVSTGQVITTGVARWVLKPFALLLQFAVLVLATLVAEIMSQLLPLLQWLIGDVALQELQERMEVLQDFRPPDLPEDPTGSPLLSPALQRALVTVLVTGAVLLGIWLLVRSFRRWQLNQSFTPGGVRERVGAEGGLAEDLTDYLRDQWAQLRHLADPRRFFTRMGTGSPQTIYANLLALMAAGGYPRQPEQTPYEYQPVATQALSGCESEIAHITVAYVAAHYGEVAVSAQELATLQEDWRTVKTEGKMWLEQT